MVFIFHFNQTANVASRFKLFKDLTTFKLISAEGKSKNLSEKEKKSFALQNVIIFT